MAVDIKKVSELEVEPGTLPKTMAAWVIREEREGEPMDAFGLEEIEVPEPDAFEVIVRVMAAGVNYNNVWAALGQPVGVWRYGDHPDRVSAGGGAQLRGEDAQPARGAPDQHLVAGLEVALVDQHAVGREVGEAVGGGLLPGQVLRLGQELLRLDLAELRK